MKLKTVVKVATWTLLVDTGLAATSVPTSGDPPALSRSEYMTNRVIVQFSEQGSSQFRESDGSIDTSALISEVSDAAGQVAAPVLTFDSELFKGVSLELSDLNASSIASIKDIRGVQNAWPAGRLTIPPASEAMVKSDGAPVWTPHKNTRVDKLHELGERGAGVVVAIIDSGVDYSHPALGGGFGPGFKVEGGYDFVGDSYDGNGEAKPDLDPMDCQGHGTHVAGIIGSTRKDLPGVASDARLRSYKVFGCGGTTTEDIVIAAAIRAYEEGADVLNLSLGSAIGFPYMAISMVLTAIQASGTFVSASAGNAGALGPFFVGNTGQGFETMTVAAAEENEQPLFTVTAHSSNGATRIIPYLDWIPSKAWNRTGLVDAHFDNDTTTRNNCGRLASHGPIPNSDDIVLLRAGDCPWLTIDGTLWDTVRWVFMYNREGAGWEVPTRFIIEAERQAVGFAAIAYEDGMWLLDQHNENATVQYEFFETPKTVPVNVTGADGVRAASYSSIGPTLDVRMKPEIAAPGSNILSTYLVKSGSWAIYSGTSMAAPYIAGVAALYLSVHGTRETVGAGASAAARKRIIASAKPIARDSTSDAHISVVRVGAGLVDAFKAVEYTTSVEPAVLELNQTAFFKKEHTIKVTNADTTAVTYQIFHQVLNSVLMREQGNREMYVDPILFGGDGWVATAELSTSNITVQPGESAEFTVTFAEPDFAWAYLLPTYAGNIILAGSNGEDVRVTYMGLKGSLKDEPILGLTSGTYPIYLKNDYSGDVNSIQEGDVFYVGGRPPATLHTITWPTEELSYDYVAADWTPQDWIYPPVQGQNKWFGSLHSSTLSYPVIYQPRLSGLSLSWGSDRYSQGGLIQPGEYRLLGRGLSTGGDRNNINDWQYKLSPRFFVKEPSDGTTTSSTSASSEAMTTLTTLLRK